MMGFAPKQFVLYKYFDYGGGTPLYIGRTTNPVARDRNHEKDSFWYRDVDSVRYEYFDSEEELKRAEIEAIRSERPLYNKNRHGGGVCSTADSGQMWMTRNIRGHVITEKIAMSMERHYLNKELERWENTKMRKEIWGGRLRRGARHDECPRCGGPEKEELYEGDILADCWRGCECPERLADFRQWKADALAERAARTT